jgi:D-amino-acid dehydrogenase
VIVSGTAAIVPGSSSSIGLRWADSRVSAGAVIAATGAWLCEDPALIAIAQAVRPERGQIVHLATLGERSVAIPVLSSLTGGYVVAFDDGHVVVGATHERAGFDADVTAGGVNAVLRDGFDLAPGLKGARFLAARAGLRPTSVDGVPLLGSVPGLGHVVLAGGLGAHGLTLGPAIGRLALQLAVGDDAACDVAPLAPARFITHC